MTNLLFRKIFIYLFFAIGIGIGCYKYGFQRIYHPYSQWDLKTHIAAVHRVIDGNTQFNPDFTERAYLPPFLPIAYPLFDLLGNINWNIIKFIWILLSSILIIIMIYLTSDEIKKLDTDFNKNQLGMVMFVAFLFKGTFLLLAAGQIWESLQQFEFVSRNNYLLKALSGRVDLAPFLAVFGFRGAVLYILQIIIFVSGLTAIIIFRKRMTDRLLLFNSVALFYTIFYYRDYDVLLPLLIALPLIWLYRHKYQLWHTLLFFPAVLPIQRIFEVGVGILPAGEIIFNLIGTSMIVSVSALVILLNNFQHQMETLRISDD